MDWKNVGKQIVKTGAPLLGGVLGGPGGAVIGGLVARIFGADPDDPEDVARKIAADPDALIKLKQLEMEHKRELEKMYLADVQSARQREIEVTKATGKTNWPLYILAGVVVGGFFVLVGLLMRFEVPDGSREVAYMLFGSLAASFGGVVNYFFGSSKGSSDKNTALITGGAK